MLITRFLPRTSPSIYPLIVMLFNKNGSRLVRQHQTQKQPSPVQYITCRSASEPAISQPTANFIRSPIQSALIAVHDPKDAPIFRTKIAATSPEDRDYGIDAFLKSRTPGLSHLLQILETAGYKGPIHRFPVVIPNVSCSLVGKLENLPPEMLEDRLCSFEYNAFTRTLRIGSMPDFVHGLASQTFPQSLLDVMKEKRFLRKRDFGHYKNAFINTDIGTTIRGFEGKWELSRKEPDFALFNLHSKSFHPGFVVESGNSESQEKLHEDKDVWIGGSKGKTHTVLLTKVTINGKPIDTTAEEGLKEYGTIEDLYGSDTEDSDSGVESIPKNLISVEKACGISGYIELWRHKAGTVVESELVAKANIPLYPSRRSEAIKIRLDDIYGPNPKDLPKSREPDEEFEVPAVWLRDIIVNNWSYIERETNIKARDKRKYEEMQADGDEVRDHDWTEDVIGDNKKSRVGDNG